ncbi:hypothetical protein ACB265_06980 [Aeromonas dhakensis]|uniref:hypothetical protein n=1 Tax=Aeromonas dhakensis TaxID=196024 RepID=UPI00227B83BB|nr:hypothetical protein [Aeromonas dhakensis]WAF69134.1 hypothetical protein NRK98_03555 [Aeromonas dhakensis]HDX8590848.1 hypothetical protein [Aeromonas dhakensis]
MSPATGGEEGSQSHHKNDVGDEKTSQLEINRSIRRQQIGVTSSDVSCDKNQSDKTAWGIDRGGFQ